MTAVLDVEKLGDGLYILHDNDAHFIAARCIDGAWEVNLQNRRHTWQDLNCALDRANVRLGASQEGDGD